MGYQNSLNMEAHVQIHTNCLTKSTKQDEWSLNFKESKSVRNNSSKHLETWACHEKAPNLGQ